jgi:excisionase family DNA binding protein
MLKQLFGGDTEALLDLLNDYQSQLRRTTTVTEFANIVGISRSLAYQIVAEKRVRSLRIRGRIVIPRSAINDFLEGRADETPAQ